MLQRKKMLIVDDQEINRVLLKEMLKNEYTFLEASDGKEAIRLLDQERNQISLVLLDMIMPVLDGLSVLYHIKDSALDQIPVVLITVEQEQLARVQEAGCKVAGILTKPFDVEKVKQVIAEAKQARG